MSINFQAKRYAWLINFTLIVLALVALTRLPGCGRDSSRPPKPDRADSVICGNNVMRLAAEVELRRQQGKLSPQQAKQLLSYEPSETSKIAYRVVNMAMTDQQAYEAVRDTCLAAAIEYKAWTDKYGIYAR